MRGKHKEQPAQLVRIGRLFEKYQKTLIPPQKTVERACKDVVFEVTAITLDVSSIHFTPSTQTIRLQVPSIIKNEIKLCSEEILAKLRTRLEHRNVPNVIL